MEWKEYLHKFSRLLVLSNGVDNAMEILGEVDDLHWSAVQSGKTDEAFIAEFGLPDAAARELAAERPSHRHSEQARFGAGIALLCLAVLLCQTQLTQLTYPGKDWVPLFLAVLVPLALWGLLKVRARLVVDLFTEEKKRWYGGWVGVFLSVLYIGLVLSWAYLYSLFSFLSPVQVVDIFRSMELFIGVLALVGVARGLWDTYLCRVEGFASCCLWLGVYCTHTLAMRPLRGMNSEEFERGFLYLELPAIICLVMTVALAILLRLWLKKMRGEVRAQWTRS